VGSFSKAGSVQPRPYAAGTRTADESRATGLGWSVILAPLVLDAMMSHGTSSSTDSGGSYDSGSYDSGSSYDSGGAADV
jgi:hypothetical protein